MLHPSGRTGDNDEIIYFGWHDGQVLNGGRYVLQKLMGDGTFGRVVSALDVKRYMANAKIEADILKDISKVDPDGVTGCAIMYETFTHDSRFYCIVFEPLGTSLYDFLKATDFRGYWMQNRMD